MSNSISIKKHRIDSLQALRAIAFLAIFVSHVWTKLGMLGGWGVSIFFVLSGFVMTYSYYDKTLQPSFSNNVRFSLKKIKRLYSLHIIMMVFASVNIIKTAVSSHSVHSLLFYGFTVITDSVLVQSWFPHKDIYFSINSVAWFLSVCVLIYALFPMVLTRIKRLTKMREAILWMILIFIIQIIIGLVVNRITVPETVSDNFAKWATYIFPLFRCGDFVIGSCLGYIYLNKKTDLKALYATLVEIVTIALIVFTVMARKLTGGIFVNEGLNHTQIYTVTSVFIIYLFTCQKGLITKILTNKVTVYIGNISAYAFLIHIVMMKYIKLISNHLFGRSPGGWILFVLSFRALL